MMRRPPSRFAPWVLLCGLGAAQAAHGLELRRITPAGNDVDAGQQITLSFDRDVVPLGRMERTADEIPVTITPAVPCEWRWLDPKVLACQLPRDGRGRRAAWRLWARRSAAPSATPMHRLSYAPALAPCLPS